MIRLTVTEARKMGFLNPKKQAKRTAQAITPQMLIYKALVRELGENEVVYEASGLIPGRRYRADIFLPKSKIAIEMDGFRYHRSKTAFQKDRERQNIFALHGILVLRYFNRQVLYNMQDIVEQVLKAHSMRIGGGI